MAGVIIIIRRKRIKGILRETWMGQIERIRGTKGKIVNEMQIIALDRKQWLKEDT